MEYQNLIVENEGPLAVVTVNRPEVRNALDADTWQELSGLIDELDKDDSIRIVIITGAGEKAFVAGADIRSLRERSMAATLRGEGQRILNRWEAMEKVSIAAINGFALGGGCELALACDIRIAAEKAVLGLPEINLAIVPGAGGTQRLTRQVGLGKAKEMILTGDLLNAREALSVGLVNKVVPDSELMSSAREMARKILAKGPLAVKLAKAAINSGANADLQTGLVIERLAQTVLFGTEDRREGIDAFLEKRPAVYQGK
ncbi:MAG: enoyl-CoA hydratase/isomerase family protein [Thermodesulfobacteriota bacterium]